MFCASIRLRETHKLIAELSYQHLFEKIIRFKQITVLFKQI